MADATKVCKVCGKTYPYCRSLRTAEGVFRWQDVACCQEHGSEYLAAVLKSRGQSNAALSDAPAKAIRQTRKAAPAKVEEEPVAEEKENTSNE